jgi:hypothetical protein
MLLPILIAIVVLLLFFVALLMLRTALYLKAPEPIELAPELETHPELVAEHLGSAIRCETVSALQAPTNRSAFLQLHRVLERWYPRTHEFLLREYINEYSLLFTWKGSNPDQPGILLHGLQGDRDGGSSLIPVEGGARCREAQQDGRARRAQRGGLRRQRGGFFGAHRPDEDGDFVHHRVGGSGIM